MSEFDADLNRAIGRSIQAIRTELGLRQGDLAAKLKDFGVKASQQTIAKIEAGRPLKFSEAVAISQVLNCSLNEFLYPLDELSHDEAKELREGLENAQDELHRAAGNFHSLLLQASEFLEGHPGADQHRHGRVLRYYVSNPDGLMNIVKSAVRECNTALFAQVHETDIDSWAKPFVKPDVDDSDA